MHTTSTHPTPRTRLGLFAKTRAVPALLALAAFALPARAAANPFAATSLSPSTQAATVGTPFSVDIVFAVPAGGYVAYGAQAWLKFDPTKLQVVSVATGGSSPFTNVFATQVDNTGGTLTYGATGGSVSNATFTIAKVVFMPTAAGTSALQFLNVNEYIINYGPYGVNGSSANGSVTITAPAPTQTLTILGGSGSPGDIAANVEYYNPATGNWQPAYLTGGHPWGFVSGTNSWINYKLNTASDPGAGPTTNQTLWYQYRVRFTVPADAVNPQMAFSIKADNFAQVAINGVTAGGSTQFINNTYMNNVIVGAADQVNVDAVFSQAVLIGENTITLNVGDWGGLNGFNFRIDLSMQSSEPLEIVPVETDSVPPVILVPSDITAEATSAAGAEVNFAVSAVDDVDGPVSALADPASGSTFAIGTTIVDVGAADSAGNIATASFNVTVQDTIAPALTVPADVTAEATSASGAAVAYGSATATDAVGVTSLTYSAASGSTFALGTTTVAVDAGDAAGNASSGSFTVTVQDTTAPAITSLSTNAPTLWPPNHKMVAVTVSADAGDLVGVSSLKIVNVTSSEPDNGLGDGDTANDIQVTGDLTVNLRAERAGGGNGRTYTITVEASDDAGNTTTKTCTVFVPKSQGKK